MKSREELEAIYDLGKEAVVDHLQELYKTLDAVLLEVSSLRSQVSDLQAQLNQNSRNSSKPPSSDGFQRPQSLRKKSSRSSGGQKGHKGYTLDFSSNPTRVEKLTHSGSCSCGHSLATVPVSSYDSRQVFDIPTLHFDVVEYQSEIKRCPHCQKESSAPFPEGVTHKTQYGERVQSLALYLRQYQLIPLKRSSEFFQDIFSHAISEGTLVNLTKRGAKKLSSFETFVKAKLQGSAYLHLDESGLRVGGKLHWIHSAGTKEYTYYFTHEKRGVDAMNEAGILPTFKGIAIHDHWKPYFRFHCEHALCNAHHLRELTAVYQKGDQPWAKKMKKLLIQMKKAREREGELLSLKEIQTFDRRYDKLIAKALRTNPEPPQEVGKRGRKKKGKIRSLIERLKDFKQEVLLFFYNPIIPFDNNLAERDIRMIKVQQKISGAFHNKERANEFCLIRSFISTAKKQNINVLEAIQMVINNIHPQHIF